MDNAVFFHVYYEDAYQKVEPLLKKLQGRADIFFNFIQGHPRKEFLERIRAEFPDADFLFSPNPGRDIRGYFNCLQHVYQSERNYQNYFFLHTKTQKDAFGKRVLHTLTHSILDLDRTLKALQDTEIGMVGSRECLYEGFYYRRSDYGEFYRGADICNRLDIEFPPSWKLGTNPILDSSQPGFIACTMFAVKSEVIDFFLRKEGVIEEFCQDFTEDGKSYGGWHHAWERVFGLMVYARNMRIFPI